MSVINDLHLYLQYLTSLTRVVGLLCPLFIRPTLVLGLPLFGILRFFQIKVNFSFIFGTFVLISKNISMDWIRFGSSYSLECSCSN